MPDVFIYGDVGDLFKYDKYITWINAYALIFIFFRLVSVHHIFYWSEVLVMKLFLEW
jgi:hypothetical protein